MESSFNYALFVELLSRSKSGEFNKSEFTRAVIKILDGKNSEFLDNDKNKDYVNNLNNGRKPTKNGLALMLNEENSKLEELLKEVLSK